MFWNNLPDKLGLKAILLIALISFSAASKDNCFSQCRNVIDEEDNKKMNSLFEFQISNTEPSPK